MQKRMYSPSRHSEGRSSHGSRDLTDAGVEDVPGGQAGLLDFQEEKVGVGWVGL